ncbi:hypothetical protein C8R45DRAFT_637220 [Mycena sanguinolenta]|nr:hypothetical protein C8R45DRAFT_637220 [Mycena sanguinolenta]
MRGVGASYKIMQKMNLIQQRRDDKQNFVFCIARRGGAMFMRAPVNGIDRAMAAARASRLDWRSKRIDTTGSATARRASHASLSLHFAPCTFSSPHINRIPALCLRRLGGVDLVLMRVRVRGHVQFRGLAACSSPAFWPQLRGERCERLSCLSVYRLKRRLFRPTRMIAPRLVARSTSEQCCLGITRSVSLPLPLSPSPLLLFLPSLPFYTFSNPCFHSVCVPFVLSVLFDSLLLHSFSGLHNALHLTLHSLDSHPIETLSFVHRKASVPETGPEVVDVAVYTPSCLLHTYASHQFRGLRKHMYAKPCGSIIGMS